MSAWKISLRRMNGTILLIPLLTLTAVLGPFPLLRAVALLLLVGGLLLQYLPVLALPEVARSFRLASQGKWAQARFYNVLAQDKLRRQPWRGGLRLFRTAHEPPTMAMLLRADCGRLWLGLGQPREAEKALRAALREWPNNGPCWHNLGLAFYAQGRPRQARAALLEAMRRGFVQPAPEILWKKMLRRLPGRFRPRLNNVIFRATFYRSLGFHEIALDCLSFLTPCQSCWWRVSSLLALGRSDTARRLALSELGRNPVNGQAWMSLGFLEAQEGNFEQAIRLYRKALRCCPTDQECREQLHVLLARTRGRRGLLDALAVLEEHETSPCPTSSALLIAGLGHWEASLKRLAPAGRTTRGAPSRSLALLELLGHCSLNLGQHAIGVRLLRRFTTLAEVSGLPMLHREERLRQARRAVAAVRPWPGQHRSPQERPSP